MFYWNFVFSCNNNVSNNVNVPYTYLHFWLFSKGSPYIITYSLTISDATICDFLSAGYFVFLADWPVWFISAQINEYFNLSHVTRIRLLFRKCMKIPPKSFVTRFNDFGRVSFNGKFYQSLLILQAFIFMSRKHSIRFEFIFYSILFLFIAYFTNIYFYQTLPIWKSKLFLRNLRF